MARVSKRRATYVHSSSQVCSRALHSTYIHIYYTYYYMYYSFMYQFREWVGRYMKCTTGRKIVMHSGMKQNWYRLFTRPYLPDR